MPDSDDKGNAPKRPPGFVMDEEEITKSKVPKKPAAPLVSPLRQAPPLKFGQRPTPGKPGQPGAKPGQGKGLLQLDLGAAKKETTATQKKLLTSQFENQKAFDQILGKTARPKTEEEEEEESERSISQIITMSFDGETPAPSVTSRDIWKAIQAPAQSKEGHRSQDVYRRVIDQFAVGTNPRYEPDGPDKLRSHIFAWDVSRAMDAEIPHFLGVKEMNLPQTVDWLRLEAPMKGWRKVSAAEAIEGACGGFLVVALPKDPRTKAIAIVRPDPAGSDGQPRFASAGKKRGNDLGLFDALGAFAAEYFAHA